jgi:hypothetical protein
MKEKFESLKEEKFRGLSKSKLNIISGGGSIGYVADCTGGGGERSIYYEKGPNGTIRYRWRMWKSDDRYGQNNVYYEWGPYYTP